jgi:hypothetical protein
LDQPVLVANLVSGGLWLAVLALRGLWPLALVGAAYVVVAGAFLAAVYARASLTRRQEAWAWVVAWLAAVALWVALLVLVDDGTGPGWVAALVGGSVIATLVFLGWQLTALAVRQVLAWRSAPTRR